MRERVVSKFREPVLDQLAIEAGSRDGGEANKAYAEIDAWRLRQGEAFLIFAPKGSERVGAVFRTWPQHAWPELPAQVRLRDRWVPRPAWLTPALPVFWHPTVGYRHDAQRLALGQWGNKKDAVTDRGRPVFTWSLPDCRSAWFLYPFTTDGIAAFLAALDASVLYERHRRGYPARDARNALNLPELTGDGLPIVERLTPSGAAGGAGMLIVPDLTRPMADVYDGSFDKAYRGPVTQALRAFDGSNPEVRSLWELNLVERGSRGPPRYNPFAPLSTEHGAAQFAWLGELRGSEALACGNADAVPGGYLLGRFDPGDWDGNGPRPTGVFARGEGHRLIVGPPGSGKFTAAIAPLLLLNDEASAFVFDVADGEAARLTAPWRARLGAVMALDPFGVSRLPAGALNPLDLFDLCDPDLLQRVKRLADALFVANDAGENAQYFNNQARDVLASLLLHLVSEPGETATLQRLRQIVRRPLDGDLLAAMEENPIAGGIVADTAANLMQAAKSGVESNSFYVLQTLRANTDFLDLPSVQRVTARTTLDPRALREEVCTLYVCLPEHELQAVSRWLRLVYSTVMENVRTRAGVPLNVVLDEFPALGRFDRVLGDMAQTRKFGIHYHLAVQSLAQLEALYERGWQAFMGVSKVQQLLGTNDNLTADYFSKRLGRTTRRGTATSQSRTATGGTSGASENWIGVDLMSPDELGRLPAHETLVVVEGGNPLRLRKAPWWESAPARASAP